MLFGLVFAVTRSDPPTPRMNCELAVNCGLPRASMTTQKLPAVDCVLCSEGC